MGTAEILIVFSALMALIALVTIGIDWIGKPLKHRRFIPRIYRFEDEKLPIDEYGHTQLTSPSSTPPNAGYPVGAYPTNAYAAGAFPANGHAPYMPAPTMPAPTHPHAPALTPAPRSNPTVQAPVAAPHGPASPPGREQVRQPAASGSPSAFSDSLVADVTPAHDPRSTIAGTATSGAVAPAPDTGIAWHAGMALDTNVDDRKPSLAIKAERFWVTTAGSLAGSHFDDENIARMASGKAPRRTNPRTGKTEAMQLTGLRQASTTEAVRMRWPDDAADPWAAS